MAKFASTQHRPALATYPIGTVSRIPDTTNHEGQQGFTRDPKSELFLLAVSNMAGEDTYYESALMRDERYRNLVHAVVAEDEDWVRRFIPWLREKAHMRSASIIAVAEFIKAGGSHGRQLIKTTLQRADEPAELLAYWQSTYGRSLPMPLKRGIADSVQRLYTELSMLKYDSSRHAVRPADVIALCHPTPIAPWQLELFRWLGDKRHNRSDARIGEKLTTIVKSKNVTKRIADGEDVTSDEMRDAGITWERQSSVTKMDASAWERQIPSMGYMALLRNLRNFDEAGISEQSRQFVTNKIADPLAVSKSKQFPYRFWAAYKNAPSLNWAAALEAALDVSTQSIPDFAGKTLVLIDTSGSMNNPVSEKSAIRRVDAAGLFGAAIAKRCQHVDTVIFGVTSKPFNLQPQQSILRYMDSLWESVGSVGHETYGYRALKQHYDGHDRVVFVTDEQMHDELKQDRIPLIYTFNLGGYAPAMMSGGANGRYVLGGLSDATFTMMEAIEQSRAGSWPF